MPGTNEALSGVGIDAQLKDRGRHVINPNAVRFEYVFQDKTKADYVLCDPAGTRLPSSWPNIAATQRDLQSSSRPPTTRRTTSAPKPR